MLERLPLRGGIPLESAAPRTRPVANGRSGAESQGFADRMSTAARKRQDKREPTKARADRPAAALEASGLSWGPPGRANVIEDVSVSIGPGQCLGVVGPNGAGKSTLLRMIYRYYRPRTGSVRLDGVDIWQIDARAAARQVAAVLQETPAEFELTVGEIVALGRAPYRSGIATGGKAERRIVENVLVRMGIERLRRRRMATLSGGERQRVMIARALAQEPRLIVLDEPTNHLDIRYQLEVLDTLLSLGITVVCSLHDLNTAMHFSDAVLALSGGRPLAFGRPSEVLSPDLVATAFSVGARAETLSGSGRPVLTFHL